MSRLVMVTSGYPRKLVRCFRGLELTMQAPAVHARVPADGGK